MKPSPRHAIFLSALILAGGTACSDDPTGTSGTLPDFRILDTDFLGGKYFFLADPDSAPAPQVREVRLYLDDGVVHNDAELGAQFAKVWLDPDDRGAAVSDSGVFNLLVPDEDYILDFPAQWISSPVIVLDTPLLGSHTLAAAYSVTDQNGNVIDTVGVFKDYTDTTTVLELKMLRPADDEWLTHDLRHSPWAPVRRLEMKNAYYLGARDIDPVSFRLRVVRDIAGAGGDNPPYLDNEFGVRTPLIEVLGLDQKNNAYPGDRIPDGRVDPEHVDYENGILFFPDLRPFDPSPVDVNGGTYRLRSWPGVSGESRPDTLGWTVNTVTGEGEPSSFEVRERETVPEIYDLLRRELELEKDNHHTCTLEVFLGGTP